MTTFYHYTTNSGCQGIKQSGEIMESITLDGGDDARFGRGVYLTTLPPSAGKEVIIKTCWSANVVTHFLQTGRVDYYIKVTIPPNLVERATIKRDVYLHKGVLILKDYPWGSGKV
ncbi:hypothetical protein ACOMHN_014333 [Nucella lapillus]